MSSATESSAVAAAHSFSKILDRYKSASKTRSSADVEEATKKLRRLILVDGIPSEVDPTLRPRIWKVLLHVRDMSAGAFLEYVGRGPCEVREKIRNDTFRTLATDRGFKERVSEEMLVRLLDAFVWRNHDRHENDQLGFTYVQGMNVLAAPFLYTMPSELEAFYCFAKFIEESCPLYVQPTLEGVHYGLKCATLSPMRLLRTFPPLEALPVIGIAVTLVRDLPTDLYDELVRHPYAVRE
ncbi:Cell division control protein 16 [Trametes pubescens]|uniref:Cell division control protein 16 n=1 Tax=Trametes pubescens TaxID=154538 RepID=A0A1M2VNH4_TRAPU|nr:Cell division control protein 16 [Trametes pubescens]